jgi:hypothetical protein
MKFAILNQVNFDAFDLLKPTVVNCGSALSIAVYVQRPADGFTITGCKVRVTNADGTPLTIDATLVGSDYVATFPASHFERYGRVENGVAISVLGADENGVERVWIERMGSLYIRPTDAQSEAGSGVCPTRAEVEAGWWSEWTTVPGGPYKWTFAYDAANGEWVATSTDGEFVRRIVSPDGENAVELTIGRIEDVQYTATRHRVAAPVPTKPEDIGAASVADATLTPVYSQTPTWTFVGLASEWKIATGPEWDSANSRWDLGICPINVPEHVSHCWVNGSQTDALIVFPYDGFAPDSPAASGGITATRTDIVGFILGSQSDKPLQPQGDYATTAQLAQKADVSAIPYDLGTPIVIDTASSEVVEGETVYYGAASLADRTSNIVQVTAATPLDELRITFPAATSGKVRDFGLRVEVGTGSAALTAPALVPPAGVTLENADGEIPALADGTATAAGVTLLYFSETAPGVFLVKGEQVKEA